MKPRAIYPRALLSKPLAKGDYKEKQNSNNLRRLRIFNVQLGCLKRIVNETDKKNSKQKAQLSILRRKWAVFPQCLKNHLFKKMFLTTPI